MRVMKALARAIVENRCCGDQLEECQEEVARLLVLERELRDELSVARCSLLAREAHFGCVPRDEMIRLAHKLQQAEFQRELARDHAAHVVSACRCDGIGEA